MKLNKTKVCHIGILLIFYALMVFLLIGFQYAYGSKTDWMSQHYAIPDYFRKLFYETGDLFPSFAPNIGAGENIYYLSYYGLYSPIILLSYLLPFIKMSTYIQAISMIGIAVDIILFYIFISRKFNDKISFLLTFLFMCSDGLIFHSHRHIMFINYMPFLLLGLMAVEDYFYKGRNIRLSIYSFLIILCSYYFSIPALIAMTVYGVSCYLRINKKFEIKKFLISGMGFALRIVIGILMAGVLLLPTLAVMLSGRDNTNSNFEISKLIPKVSLNFFSTNCYSMGVSCFLIAACIVGIMSKVRGRRFLSIAITVLITCPIFVYALNMGMYIDPKVLIPFTPLAVLVIGESYEDLSAGKFKPAYVLIISIVSVVWGIVAFSGHEYARVGTTIDGIVFVLLLSAFIKFRKKTILILSMTGISFSSMIIQNFGDVKPTLSQMEDINSKAINSLAETIKDDNEIYRASCLSNRVDTPNMIYNSRFYSSTIYSSLHNELYNHFYFDEIKNENEFRNSALTTASQNVLFKILMGEKYIIADDTAVPCGYQKVKNIGKYTLYKNDKVMPIGFASSRTISEQEYRNLEYPKNVEALSNYIIVPDKQENNFISQCKKYDGFYLNENEHIKLNGDKYSVSSKTEFKESVNLKDPLTKNQIMLLRFTVDNSEKQDHNDSRIMINGIKNTLTTPSWKYFNNNNSFEYVLTTNGNDVVDQLDIEFSKGVYKISDIETYVIEYPNFYENCDELKLNKDKTKGDIIEGDIICKDNEYFQISLPYDNGFTITVDGKEQEYQISDTAFIGFPISKGEHHIKIEFNAPLLNVGKIVSLFGLVLLLITGVSEIAIQKKK